MVYPHVYIAIISLDKPDRNLQSWNTFTSKIYIPGLFVSLSWSYEALCHCRRRCKLVVGTGLEMQQELLSPLLSHPSKFATQINFLCNSNSRSVRHPTRRPNPTEINSLEWGLTRDLSWIRSSVISDNEVGRIGR